MHYNVTQQFWWKLCVSPVMQDVIGQINEMQAELEMHPICSDAVSEMRRHQLAVRRGLSVTEHPVLSSLRMRNNQKMTNLRRIRQRGRERGRFPARTNMASLVQVSMMGCSRLSNSVMSSCVSTSSFCICCSIAREMAAVNCSWNPKTHIYLTEYINVQNYWISRTIFG